MSRQPSPAVKALTHLGLLLAVAVAVYPVLWVLKMAFSESQAVRHTIEVFSGCEQRTSHHSMTQPPSERLISALCRGHIRLPEALGAV